MWNIKKSNKKNKGIATENRIVVTRQGKGEGEGKMGEGDLAISDLQTQQFHVVPKCEQC